MANKYLLCVRDCFKYYMGIIHTNYMKYYYYYIPILQMTLPEAQKNVSNLPQVMQWQMKKLGYKPRQSDPRVSALNCYTIPYSINEVNIIILIIW